MAITTLNKLVNTIRDWFEKQVPKRRLANDSEGRLWALQALNYSGDDLKLESLRDFTDRDDLNDKFVKRTKVDKEASRLGTSAIKIEISALYSFNKCFVQRFKGRMHYYRDDLAQKGQRNMRTVGQSIGVLNEFKKQMDKN
jgi:hypothetical protein